MPRILIAVLVAMLTSVVRAEDQPLAPVSQRFAAKDARETPSFQRHVIPLMGRLGCNGRACHGSFQGRGGFRLSLFGYDFDADHAELLKKQDEPRVHVEKPQLSLILTKPIDADMHEGGQRYKPGSWEAHLLRRWIDGGAINDGHKNGELVKLEVLPAEIVFAKEKDTVQLRCVAHWSDGTREDVTPICRFQTNDDAVATVNADGLITSATPGDTHIVAFYDNGITPVPVMLPISRETAGNYPQVATSTKVDELVVAKLKKLGIVPAEKCTDAEFLRRVSLDLTGTLPSAAEVDKFLADPSATKRTDKVDELLKRPAYAAWWATKFSDFTGNAAQQGGNNAFRNEESKQWYEWLRTRVEQNMPYDEMMEGIILATSRREGQDFQQYCDEMGTYYRKTDAADFAEHPSMPHYWSRRNIRQPEEKALSFAYSFMGVRIQCAQCHKHPFDQWSKQDFEQFTAFFAGVTYGIRPQDREATQKMYADLGLDKKDGGERRRSLPQFLNDGKTIPFQEVYASGRPYQRREDGAKVKNKDKKNRNRNASRVITPKLLGGDEVIAKKYGDPRVAVMEWLRSPENPYFARALVNRVWANYFHRGIVEPADDLNLANPPSNEPLLDYLTQGFIEHDYDLQWLHREIIASDTYQRSWKPNASNRLDERNFSRAVPRRLPAEVVSDALQLATASDEQRAAFAASLEGRAIGPTTAYQNRGRNGYVLTTFGKPARIENCDCERSPDTSLLQVLYIRNDNETLSTIDRRGSWLEQVAAEHKLAFNASAPNGNEQRRREGRRLRELGLRIRELDQKIAALTDEDKKDEKRALEDDRQRLRRKFRELARAQRGETGGAGEGTPLGDEKPMPDAASAEKTLIDEQGAALVRQAYLRTLSRQPDERELSRSVEYLRTSPNLMSGMRDVMWALINTKEFIVNH